MPRSYSLRYFRKYICKRSGVAIPERSLRPLRGPVRECEVPAPREALIGGLPRSGSAIFGRYGPDGLFSPLPPLIDGAIIAHRANCA